ncbi:MAG TPA: glycosyltransferase [Rhodanobacteraceae bacterium]|nr:glycosyltransferase [Rhodanobacteraceae bacterium]
MTAPVFFTIVSRNYLAYALTLMGSISGQYPDSPRYLCLADEPGDDADLDTPLFEVVPIRKLGLPHFEAFVFRYDIMELNTAVKPYMFAWLRERHPDAGLVYLDPDILVLRRLEKVEQAFADGALLVLTPHLNAPMSDDKFPDELAIMRSGVYNCGFAAINAAHARAADLIAWWSKKLEFGCFVDIEGGLFTDQKWMDLAPGMFPDVRVLRDDGYNVAYWNLAQRPITGAADGGYTAAGVPLVFVHFSGVVLSDPKLFSKHQDRFTADSIGGLRPLYERYLRLLAKNGHKGHAQKPYAYGRFPDGEKIVTAMRRAFRRAFDVDRERPVRDPMRMDRDLFNQPTDELVADESRPVSRLMFEIWAMREDLQQAFNLQDRAGRDGFVRWYLASAGTELAMNERYVAPIRELFERAALVAEESNPGPVRRGPRYRLGQVALRVLAWGKRRPLLARWYARLPQSWRMGFRRRAHSYSGVPFPLATLPHASRLRVPTFAEGLEDADTRALENGVNLIGYARGEFGIAENVRSYARALEQAGHPFLIRNFDVGVASRQQDHSMERHFSEVLRYDINVFFINADQMQVARDTLGKSAFDGRHNVGYWLWELEHFPRAWQGAFDLVDEVWAPTEFVRAGIAANTRKPVLKMPKAIEFEAPTGMDRAHFGLDADACTFLFSYDFNGFAARKNPEAVITAFRQAFPVERRDVRLLVKSVNGHRFPERLSSLASSVADDPRIEIRDGFLSRGEMHGLQNAIDCYVSLHRAEGFGLGLAECMYLGKPVIGTAWSGNMEFMTHDNACLVDYRLVPVGEGEYPFWQDQHWAEADVQQAAMFMRRVSEDREWARALGARAARDIRANLSREVCAASVISRMRAVSGAGAGASRRSFGAAGQPR